MADPKLGSTNYNVVQLDGQAFTINSVAITVLLRDQNGNVLWSTGATVPTAGSAGYAVSSLFSATGILWQNKGSTTSSNFVPTSTAV